MGEIRTLPGGQLPPQGWPRPSQGWPRPQGLPPAAAHPHLGSPKHRSFHDPPWERPISQGTSHSLLSSNPSRSCFLVGTPS